MAEPLFLKPVFHEKIWGGNSLKKMFNYNIPSDKTGECWGISGHPHGVTRVINGKYASIPLDKLWHDVPNLFGDVDTSGPFPLLIKILDANKDLSVQVHPNDSYALKNEREFGKTECWYIIHADEGAELYYGHNAKSHEELVDWINNNRWNQLLRKIPVKTGEFYYVPAGMIHALGRGIVVLETQQSSDTTYRLYDFNRVNQVTGKLRELHKKQAIDTITVPATYPNLNYKLEKVKDAQVTTFITSPFFSVQKIELTGSTYFTNNPNFKLISVISGEGILSVDGQNYGLFKGQHLILPNNVQSWKLKGKELVLIQSNPENLKSQ